VFPLAVVEDVPLHADASWSTTIRQRLAGVMAKVTLPGGTLKAVPSTGTFLARRSACWRCVGDVARWSTSASAGHGYVLLLGAAAYRFVVANADAFGWPER
jgi:hypothetical protein